MSISESVYKFEAILSSMDPNSDGTLKVSFIVSPNDVNDILLDMAIGGIFMVAAAKIGDDGSIEKPFLMEMGDRAFRSAAALCRNERFQEWLIKTEKAKSLSEEEAATSIRKMCKIKSRTELKTNQTAIMRFEQIRSEFKEAIRSGKV